MPARLIPDPGGDLVHRLIKHRPWPGWRRQRCMTGCGRWPCAGFWTSFAELVSRARPGEYAADDLRPRGMRRWLDFVGDDAGDSPLDADPYEGWYR